MKGIITMKEKVKATVAGILFYVGLMGMFALAYWWGYCK
jgi:hypothetical protein